MAPTKKDWATEIAKNGRLPTTDSDFKEMVQQMNYMGLKGPYHPKNQYPGSPYMNCRRPTAAQVRKEAKFGSERVLSDWNILRKIVERHAGTIDKRWMKKTRKKQKELLLQAWPSMSPTHRPDFEAYRMENTGRHHRGLSKHQAAFKWPYINQQDLSTRSLVLFINNRGLNPPSMFARADIDATRLGSNGHWIPEQDFLLGYTMFMDGDNSETYGKLVSWDGDQGAAGLLFSQRQFSPGEGLRVLELQEKIYPFLVKCCELILHDLVENGTLLGGELPAPLEDEAATAKTPEVFVTDLQPSLATISAEAPYRLPANLDLERLRAIFAARLSAAEDNLWLLREDPGYFADTIMDWSEHRNDRLLDTRGQQHPTGPQTTQFWERVIRNVIADAYTGFETWSLLHRCVSRLCKLKEKYKDQISYDRQLPEEFLITILKLQQLLLIACETPLHNLKNIQSSPPLRHYFIREPQDPGTINMHIRPINELDPHFHKPWALLLILWDEQQRELFGLPNVIDYFEWIMQDPTEKKNLSPYMADCFADLAILSRALHEINIYHPWAATFEDENKKHVRKVMEIMKEATFQINYLDNMDRVMQGITQLAMPKDGKFDYPIDKKRTKVTTEAMINAEKNLDLFWSKFDANWRRLAGKNIDKCMGDHTPRQSGEKIEPTQAWVEPIKEPKKGKAEPLDSDMQAWMESTSINEKVSSKPSKRKVKTKGAATEPATLQNAAPQPLATQPDKQPTFRVSAPSLRVFNTLFFTPGATGNVGEVPWIDFLRAMTSTGFAAQKLYGSIWQFTPTKLDVERSIQFHEPHPEVKIRFSVARRMGRRLTRAYGWHGAMFKLDK
ncbi:hypothetical protein L207DRAFT_588074 [Hyaloscypha variabilis F]|uniref:Uncharacterized protein n=1 Tax=Hyaloscypha variabilis (strain UAMH 11265 / GT02V1 / F) TaxID=1149755 RepID=A0A2J6R7T0_HYAVF|nr:hypothetical protein L207DRAFT_588074 [Hyaloscypha variabilis F]